MYRWMRQVPFHSQMGGLVSGPQIAVEASCPAMPLPGESSGPQLPAKLQVEVRRNALSHPANLRPDQPG